MIENFCLFPENISCISVKNIVNIASNHSKPLLSEVIVWFYYVVTLYLPCFPKTHDNVFTEIQRAFLKIHSKQIQYTYIVCKLWISTSVHVHYTR